MKNAEWNNLRARLHHDWLQNTYITFLMARVKYMDDTIEAQGAVRDDIIEQFDEFHDRSTGFEILINGAVDALSPIQLLDEYPLKSMTIENKEWLRKVTHGLYCERTGISEKVVGLREKFKSICETQTLLSNILHSKNGGLLKKVEKEPLKSYHALIQEFSSMISSLPHEVQVL